MSQHNFKIYGRGNIIQKYINIMKQDEHLMRLLYYNPKDANDNYVDFRDENLPNVTEFETDKFEEIANDLIRKSEKADDIIETKKTVIFVYLGKSVPVFGNRMLTERELIFTILSHNDFSFDYRIEEICDRLDTLFVGQRIGGIGQTRTGRSFKREAPKEYLAFEQKYIITNQQR